jgi:biopolymer transport protein TolR
MDATGFCAVLLAFWLIFTPMSTGNRNHKPVDMAHVKHATPMPGALREDANIVSVTRDGNIFLGDNQIQLKDLTDGIAKALKSDSERKIYLRADARAKYGDVTAVLRSISATGIENVALLVEQN